MHYVYKKDRQSSVENETAVKVPLISL